MLQNTPEKFAAQLQEGHYNELRVALHFMLQGAHVRIGFTGQRYDLHVLPPGGDGFGVEIKWDKRAAETGNLFFEVENTRRREPSGIQATDADYWCQVLGDGGEALLVPTTRLRAFLAEGRFRSCTTGGEDSNSRGLLVPRSRLEGQPEMEWVRLPTVEEFFGELFRRGPAAPPRVLVVDDEPRIVEFVSSALGATGYRIESAGDGREALSRLRTERFDLVISDLRMPLLDGLELLAAVRQDEALRDLPFILMAPKFADAARWDALLKCGADEVLAKPCSREALRECLTRRLRVDRRQSGGSRSD